MAGKLPMQMLNCAFKTRPTECMKFVPRPCLVITSHHVSLFDILVKVIINYFDKVPPSAPKQTSKS